MDFIINLLLSANPAIGEVYNGILVIINKYTKYISFILFKKDYLIAKLTYIFFN